MRRIATWIVLALALVEAGWMGFDGARALVVGDYVTPSTGRFAGQLGPWSGIVRRVGIEPRSTLMKCVFVTYGVAWLVVIAVHAARRDRRSWLAMLIAATGALWYAAVGTALSVLQVILLLAARPPGRRT